MQAVSVGARDSFSEGPFLEWLVQRGSLTPVTAQCVARVQADTCGRLVAILLSLGLLSESRLADALTGYCGLPRLVPEQLPSEGPKFPFINKSFLLDYEILPLRAGAATVEFACWDALDDYPLAAVKFVVGRGVSRCVGTRTEIATALGNLYGTESEARVRRARGKFATKDGAEAVRRPAVAAQDRWRVGFGTPGR